MLSEDRETEPKGNISNISNTTGGCVEYRVSPYRWLILFMISLIQVTAYVIFVTL